LPVNPHSGKCFPVGKVAAFAMGNWVLKIRPLGRNAVGGVTLLSGV
jgi:hypothetical protein